MVFKYFCVLVLWTNVVSALEGLREMGGLLYYHMPVFFIYQAKACSKWKWHVCLICYVNEQTTFSQILYPVSLYTTPSEGPALTQLLNIPMGSQMIINDPWVFLTQNWQISVRTCSQCLSQDLETGCLKMAVVKFLGVQIFKWLHNILIFQP